MTALGVNVEALVGNRGAAEGKAENTEAAERWEGMTKKKPKIKRRVDVRTQPDLITLVAELQRPDLTWCNARTTNYAKTKDCHENVEIDTREHTYCLSSKHRLNYAPLEAVLIPMLGEGGVRCARQFFEACVPPMRAG